MNARKVKEITLVGGHFVDPNSIIRVFTAFDNKFCLELSSGTILPVNLRNVSTEEELVSKLTKYFNQDQFKVNMDMDLAPVDKLVKEIASLKRTVNQLHVQVKGARMDARNKPSLFARLKQWLDS